MSVTDGNAIAKITVVSLTIVIAFVMACYLASYGVRLVLKVGTSDLGMLDAWRYWQMRSDPRLVPYVASMRNVLVGVLGSIAALIAIGLFAVLRGTRQKMYGDSRFAPSSEIARKGLFNEDGQGIIVGRLGTKLLRFQGQQFVMLAAPTRSGKGVGVVIPNLLTYSDSVVVLDIKGENFDLTSGWRASQGQSVYRLDPFATDGRTHRWNPLSYVDDDPSQRISDLMAIAAMLYPDGDAAQKFWVSQARNAFLALTMFAFDRFTHFNEFGFNGDAEKPSLGQIHRLSVGTESDLRSALRSLRDQPFTADRTRTAFDGLLSQADETFASIMGSVREPLNAWVNPILDAATAADDFDLRDVRRRKTSIYVIIPPSKLAEAKLLVNLFFSQLLNVNTRELPQNDSSLKYQCLLLLDEFTSIGKVEIIATAVAYMAGYNLRLLPIIQSVAQLDAVYGKELSRTLITNHALQILYAPREQQDAKDYSEMLGETTVIKRSRTKAKETSVSESEERRALMLPQELKAMGDDRAILIVEGMKSPVMCSKIRYYKERQFTERLLPSVEVKQLDFDSLM